MNLTMVKSQIPCYLRKLPRHGGQSPADPSKRFTTGENSYGGRFLLNFTKAASGLAGFLEIDP